MISVIRPEDDIVSQSVGKWWDDLEPSCPKDVSVKHNRRSPARRSVERAVRGAKLVIYFGHGTPRSLIGPPGVALIDRKNVAEAAGAVVVAIACYSGQKLANIAVGKGVRAYIGFDGLIAVPPGDDGPFRVASNLGAKTLLQGQTVGAALTEMRKETVHQMFGFVLRIQ